MMSARAVWMSAASMLMGLATVALATQHLLPTDEFLVRNPNPGGDATKRKVIFRQEQLNSSSTIVGDPTVSGVTLHVLLANGGDQCFDFPAIGWIPVGTSGFKYRAPGGAGAAVSAFMRKEEFSGDLILKWKLQGTKGPIDVLPQPGNASFALDFKIGDGDEYCAGGTTPAGATSSLDVYNVKKVPPPTSCGTGPCSP